MNKMLTVFLTLLGIVSFGQDDPTKEAQSIVNEGKLLYRSEMASWYGTDVFLESNKNRDSVGGYFSYLDNDIAKCVFFSSGDSPKIIWTISFDSTYSQSTSKIDLTEREFTKVENDLYQIRKITLMELNNNLDTFFTFYEDTNPNLIPILDNKEKKVYILTGPQKSGVVIFGNDYLLTFDKDNNLLARKKLHRNIIPIEYEAPGIIKEDANPYHIHSQETGDFITATDICTLMLYCKNAKWKEHNVYSKKYMNNWNCETNQLTVIPMSTLINVKDNQKKQSRKKNKNK